MRNVLYGIQCYTVQGMLLLGVRVPLKKHDIGIKDVLVTLRASTFCRPLLMLLTGTSVVFQM